MLLIVLEELLVMFVVLVNVLVVLYWCYIFIYCIVPWPHYVTVIYASWSQLCPEQMWYKVCSHYDIVEIYIFIIFCKYSGYLPMLRCYKNRFFTSLSI